MAIIDNYTKDELNNIVINSKSFVEVIDKLGYSTHSGSNHKTIKNRLDQYGIDYSHFKNIEKVKRDEDNIFVENSTASQQTLRRWYIKNNYTDYKCSICGLEPIWQGKELTLILDHINGINNDDRLENLRWVCPNCNQQLDTTGFKKLRVEKIKNIQKKYFCIDCGAEISASAQRCVECAKKNRQIVERPSRDELKYLVRNFSFVEIAKKYNVSDKSISKWCITYSIPHRKKDINKITDIEWEQI